MNKEHQILLPIEHVPSGAYACAERPALWAELEK
jgi:hypothetical protein